MSSVKIQGSATGTAAFTIAVPEGTSTDRTINLADEAGTFVTKDASNNISGVASVNGSQLGGTRNIIINGAMTVAQRGTSFTVSAVGTYTLDRFVVDESTSGTLTVSQDTESPDDFKYSMKVTPAVADTSIASAEYARIKVHLEGYDTNRFAFGTSSAKPITFSFYAKTNKTGTYCVALDLLGGTERNYMEEFSLTNSWARYELNIPANTAQAFANTTNGKAAELEIALAAGSDYHGTAGDFTNVGFATSNQINFMDSTSNELYITGLQLELGDTATDFEHESYGTTLQKCQRYYEESDRSGFNFLGVVPQTTTNREAPVQFLVRKRGTPSVTFDITSTSYYHFASNTANTPSSVSASGIGIDGFFSIGFGASAQTSGTTVAVDNLHYKADAEI